MRLKELRTEKGLTQQEVAKAIGYSVKTYAHYEQGIREPNISTLKLLSRYFGVSIDHILHND